MPADKARGRWVCRKPGGHPTHPPPLSNQGGTCCKDPACPLLFLIKSNTQQKVQHASMQRRVARVAVGAGGT